MSYQIYQNTWYMDITLKNSMLVSNGMITYTLQMCCSNKQASKHYRLSFAYILVMFYSNKQTSKHCHAPFAYKHVHSFALKIVISCNHLIIESKPWNKMSCIWSKIKLDWERDQMEEIFKITKWMFNVEVTRYNC